MHTSTRRWIFAALAAASLLVSSSCKKTGAREEASVLVLVSVVEVAGPHADSQLAEGFWGVEADAWRWAKHKFSVVLAPPFGADQKGARLELRFTLPESVIARRKSVTLSAESGGVALPPETYTSAGNYIYKADIPGSAFQGKAAVKISFSTDNYLAAGEVEGRELALIVQSIGLSTK